MAKNILVATPQPAFGEFLRLSLEESGRYRVRLVLTGREALASMGQNIFSLVILDAALSDPPFSYVVQGLRSRRPGLRLLVIPPAEGADQPEIRAAQADGCVCQPFYAPNLLETIDQLTAETPPPAAAPSAAPAGAAGPALSDIEAAGVVLQEFLKDSTAPAVLVLRAGLPWASAGQFGRAPLDEVANLLKRYTTANEGVDMARFVHLEADGGEYLIYATPLPENQVLALVYQVNTPLTVIRAQAMRLARLLHQPAAVLATSPQPLVSLVKAPNLSLSPAPPTVESELPPPCGSHLPPRVPEAGAPMRRRSTDGEATDDVESDDEQLEADALRLVDLLSEMPDPNPAAAEPADWVREESLAATEGAFLFPWEPRQNFTEPAGSIPAIVLPKMAPAARELSRPAFEENNAEDEPTETDLDAEGELADRSHPSPAALPDWLSAPPATPGEETRPVVLRTLQSLRQVEPIMPSFSHLAYTCLLIPRLPTHRLVSGLADRLREWLPQLCLAYGWRLENLFVRPEYLQWTLQVTPAISPGNVLRLVRLQSSRRIFLQFPQYEVENPSGDFWAPGFLIISGFQPPSNQLVQDFIHQTRTRQGSWTY